MQRLEVSGEVRLIYRLLGVKGLNSALDARPCSLSVSASSSQPPLNLKLRLQTFSELPPNKKSLMHLP